MNKLWFTSDSHFASDRIIVREHRPFKNSAEFASQVIQLWNDQVSVGDMLYIVGDFCSYSFDEADVWGIGLHYVTHIKCNVFLVLGNAEERLIKEEFHNNFEEFRTYCKSIGFYDVALSIDVNSCGRTLHLVHKPSQSIPGMINLFGHVHRATGLFKQCGYNVSCDVTHFYLTSEQDIVDYEKVRELFWDIDCDIQMP